MSKMKLTVLGSGSALPTEKRFNSSQILQIGEAVYMIDCGEAAQIRLRANKIKTARLNHIFISHLHGDHCFGLIGFISTMAMLGRTAKLTIHAHPDLEGLLRPLIDYFCVDIPYQVVFNPVNPRKHELILENKQVKVYTIPLKHRIPACGFLFEEKEKERQLIREKIDFYKVPIKQLQFIKKGGDFVTDEGIVVRNSVLTLPSEPAKKYAYCSDTAYSDKIVALLQGVDCLFHEATFADSEIARAKETYHSTARQAAETAKQAGAKQLIIGHYSVRYNKISKLLAEAKEVFDNTHAAEDGMSFEF